MEFVRTCAEDFIPALLKLPFNGNLFPHQNGPEHWRNCGWRIASVLYSYWPAFLPLGVTDKRPYLDRSVASMKLAVKAADDNNVTFNMEVVTVNNII